MTLTETFRKFLERNGVTVVEEGSSTIDADGKPHFHGWNVELRGSARVELGTLEAWKVALLSLAGAVQESAAE